MKGAIFTSDIFAFLRDLARNNDRAWFAENRDRYDRDVKGRRSGSLPSSRPTWGG